MSNRTIDDITLIASVFVVTGEDAAQTEMMREQARQQISFYASTPSYRVILEAHGWGDVADQLSHLAARKQWAEMPQLIADDMLDAFAIVVPPEEVGRAALERYRGRVDRIMLYLPFQPGQFERLWRSAIIAFAAQS